MLTNCFVVGGPVTLVSPPSPNETMLIGKRNSLVLFTIDFDLRVTMKRGLRNIVLRGRGEAEDTDKNRLS